MLVCITLFHGYLRRYKRLLLFIIAAECISVHFPTFVCFFPKHQKFSVIKLGTVTIKGFPQSFFCYVLLSIAVYGSGGKFAIAKP